MDDVDGGRWRMVILKIKIKKKGFREMGMVGLCLGLRLCVWLVGWLVGLWVRNRELRLGRGKGKGGASEIE